MWQGIEELLAEIQAGQKKALIALGQRIIPSLSYEDLLQPQDFDLLENNPQFRYEEGVLAGIQTVQAAVRALLKDQMTADSNESKTS